MRDRHTECNIIPAIQVYGETPCVNFRYLGSMTASIVQATLQDTKQSSVVVCFLEVGMPVEVSAIINHYKCETLQNN